MLSRRAFLAAIVAVPAAAARAPRLPSPTIIPQRKLFARVLITPEIMAMQGAWNRARSLEMELVIHDFKLLSRSPDDRWADDVQREFLRSRR